MASFMPPRASKNISGKARAARLEAAAYIAVSEHISPPVFYSETSNHLMQFLL
jgi:hypothetical protein